MPHRVYTTLIYGGTLIRISVACDQYTLIMAFTV